MALSNIPSLVFLKICREVWYRWPISCWILPSHWFSALWPTVVLDNYLQKCSLPLDIREVQITITLRFNLSPLRMARIKMTNDKCCEGYGKKRHLYTIVGSENWCCPHRNQYGEILRKSIPQKLKISLSYDPAIPLQSQCSKDSIPQRHILHSYNS